MQFEPNRITIYRVLSAALALPLIWNSCLQSSYAQQNTKEVLFDQTKTVLKKQKKKAEGGQFMGDKDAADVTGLLQKYASDASPQKTNEYKAMANLVVSYRKQMSNFGKAGGLELSNLRKVSDLNKRISLLSKAQANLNKLMTSFGEPGPALYIEEKHLKNIAAQLAFYKKHWGRWHLDKDGEVYLEVIDTEVDYLHDLLRENQELKQQQLEALRQGADLGLHNIEKAGY